MSVMVPTYCFLALMSLNKDEASYKLDTNLGLVFMGQHDHTTMLNSYRYVEYMTEYMIVYE